MITKRAIVNLLVVLAFIAIGVFCYNMGKSYNILLENLAYELEGEERPGLEALYAYVDNGKQIFMLEGDRTVAPGTGKKHVLKIEILDIEDNVVETKEIPFSMHDLGENASLNVAKAFATGTVAPR